MKRKHLFKKATALLILAVLSGCQAEQPSPNNNQNVNQQPGAPTSSVTSTNEQNQILPGVEPGTQYQTTSGNPRIGGTEQLKPAISQELKTSIEPAVPQYSQVDQAAYSRALDVKDISLCDSISDAAYKASCKTTITDSITLQDALAKLDLSLCDKLSNPSDQSYCKTQVQAGLDLNQQMNTTKK